MPKPVLAESEGRPRIPPNINLVPTPKNKSGALDTAQYMLKKIHQLGLDIEHSLAALEKYVQDVGGSTNFNESTFRWAWLHSLMNTTVQPRLHSIYQVAKTELEYAELPTDNNALSAEVSR